MTVVEWEDRFSIGIEQLDSHHQHLLGLLDRSYHAIILEQNINEVRYIFHELLAYADYHFKAEEELMQQYSYGRIKDHLAEHETFKVKIIELLDKQLTDEGKFDIEVIYFLEDWLLNHILHVDKEFSAFVLAKGYREES
jgi:hemerythrin